MKIIKLIFFLHIIAIFLSCNNLEKNKIGYLNWNASNEIALNTQKIFKTRAEELGAEVICMDAQNNDIEQYKQAIELINQGVKVLVIKPVNSISAAKIVRIANEKGVKVIANDQYIKNCALDYYVTFDSRKVGEYIAREAITQKPNGTYLMLWGDKVDENADIVKDGMLKILQPQINNGNIKILYASYVEAWSLENAENEIDMILRLSNNIKIDAILASCDDMARGSINVLKKYNLLDNVFIAGQNADLESLKMILRKEQTITIAKSPKTLGYELANLAVKLTSNDYNNDNMGINASTFNGYKDVPTIYFDPVVVTPENLETVLAKDGFISVNDLK